MGYEVFELYSSYIRVILMQIRNNNKQLHRIVHCLVNWHQLKERTL
jgi:hypothetical protein